MAEDRDENQIIPQPQEVSVVDEFVGILLHGADEGETIHVSKTQADGTMRSWSLQVGLDPNGNERIMRVDEDGVFIHTPIVTDEDGNKIPIAGTEDGVLRIDISGATKRQELSVQVQILNELRLHSMYLEEISEAHLTLKDLGTNEAKEFSG